MPSGTSKSTIALPDGRLVVVELDWDHIRAVALRAHGAKGRRAISGPVVVKAIRA